MHYTVLVEIRKHNLLPRAVLLKLSVVKDQLVFFFQFSIFYGLICGPTMRDYYAVLLMRLSNTSSTTLAHSMSQQDKSTDHMLGYHSTTTLLKMVLNICFQF